MAKVEVPAIPEDVALGPRMRALPNDRMREFAWLMAHGAWNATQCAQEAGYADNGSDLDNSKSMIRVQAHKLTHDPKIMDAIEECTRATLRGLAPLAVRRARMILENEKHPYHGRMIETVLDRTGHFAKTEHMVRVEHSVDMRELEALARRLAAESGVGVERLLGTNEGKVIEGEVVDDAGNGGSGSADIGQHLRERTGADADEEAGSGVSDD